MDNGHYQLKSNSLPKHVIWGWFQINTTISVDKCERDKLAWATYHPHFHRPPDQSNSIYFAQENLYLPGLEARNIKGAGIFPYFSSRLQLTKLGSRPSHWKLPGWMYPQNEASALSYHGDLKRWEKGSDYVLLKTVGRGQEFVFNSSYYPDTINWLINLFENLVLGP